MKYYYNIHIYHIRYQSAGLNEKLKECTSELMELSRREIELEKEKNAIVEEIDAIKSELALQKVMRLYWLFYICLLYRGLSFRILNFKLLLCCND